MHTSPSWGVSGLLERFDESIRTSLQTVTNLQINFSAWAQSILLAARGSLGICSAVDLSLSNYLSSLHGTSKLVSSISSTAGIAVEYSLLHEVLDLWSAELPLITGIYNTSRMNCFLNNDIFISVGFCF